MSESTNIRVAISQDDLRAGVSVNRPAQVLFASLIGTTIEFFDFYIYATAAVLVFPKLFFPVVRSGVGHARLAGDVCDRVPRAADRLGALRPLRRSRRPQDHARRRAAHDGALDGRDRRAADLRARSASLRRCCSRSAASARASGLGGEWGGAVLLAIENAPPGKRAWYGMFPQLGAPIGFFFSGGIFLVLSRWLTDEQFFAFGWRIPFLASAALVLVGLYVRLTITETPVFRDALSRRERVKVPMLVVFRDHPGALVVGHAGVARDVRALLPDDGLRAVLGHHRARLQPREVPADAAVRHPVLRADDSRSARCWPSAGGAVTLIWVTAAIGAFGLVMAPMFAAGTAGAVLTMALGLVADGPDLRPARHGAVRAVSDLGALHRAAR